MILIFTLFPFQANAMPLPAILAGLGIRQLLVWVGVTALVPLGLSVVKTGASLLAFVTAVGLVTSISGKLVNWGIAYQSNLLNPDNIPAIQTVWLLIRDFVNIFFILILLVIAFATIFNVKNYKAGDLLPKLIIAALLINFSLVITTWVIELLWVPAGVFLGPMGQNVSEQIVNALRIQSFFDSSFIATIAGGGPEALLAMGVQIGARGVLLVINAFILVWITLIIWLRIPILIGLMMVSPIVWLGFTLPAIRKNTWDAWWDKLIHWGIIPIPLFGLIYFIVYFKSRLTEQISGAVPARILSEPLSFLGFNAELVLVWIITIALFLGGLIYIKGLTGNLYNWTMAGFKGTWGGIRKGVGASVDFGYEAFGYKKAVGGIKERFAKEGVLFGTDVKEKRAAKLENRLAGLAGLEPRFAAQKNLLDQSEKASKDIDNRFKQAKSTTEEKAIIDKLRDKVNKGAKDPETLAAINALAKKGQLDVTLFNKVTDNFKDMPLALTKVFSEWKEGKFGGIKADELIPLLKDARTPLEAKRIGYNFIASDDGKRVIQDKSFDPAAFETMYETLGGRNTKAGREAKKFVGEINPVVVGEYNFGNKTTEFDDPADYPTDVADAILKQIKKTGSKDFTKYGKEMWNNPDFKSALGDLLYNKATTDIGNARKYAEEVRKWLIRESKDVDELKVFNDAATMAGI